MLIPCRIRAEANSFYSFGKNREGLHKNPELFVSCGDIPVSELCMKHEAQFRPIGIQRLICLVPLIREEGILLPCFDEGCIHIKSCAIYGIPLMDSVDEIGMDPLKGTEEFRQWRDDGLALLAGIVLVEGRKVSEDGGGGGNRPMFLLAPLFLFLSSRLSLKTLKLYTLKYAAKPFIGFKDAKVIDALSTCEV
jgi:hypothetical protein